MQRPGCGKNFETVRAIPAAAASISVSAVTPRAKAASSAVRISAELTTGESKLSPYLLEPLLPFFFLLLDLFDREMAFFRDFFERLIDRRARGVARTKSGPLNGWARTSDEAADPRASGRLTGAG